MTVVTTIFHVEGWEIPFAEGDVVQLNKVPKRRVPRKKGEPKRRDRDRERERERDRQREREARVLRDRVDSRLEIRRTANPLNCQWQAARKHG